MLKAAPDTPLITLALGELIAEHTDIPPGVVNVPPAPIPEVGAALTTSRDVGHGDFTGSTLTGRRIMAAASDPQKGVPRARRQSAAIVLDERRLQHRGTVFRAQHGDHAGQGCGADLGACSCLPNTKTRSSNWSRPTSGTCGSATRPIPRLTWGRWISEAATRSTAWSSVLSRPGPLPVTGGEKVDPGFFYTPTLLADVDPDSDRPGRGLRPCAGRHRVRDDDDAVRIANNLIYGPSGAVFGSEDRASRLRRSAPERSPSTAATTSVPTVRSAAMAQSWVG